MRGRPVAASRSHSSARTAGSSVDAVVLQPVAGTDIAERDVHQTAVARFAATDWKKSMTSLADSSGCSMRFVWPLPSMT